jgi:hypothetical protein
MLFSHPRFERRLLLNINISWEVFPIDQVFFYNFLLEFVQLLHHYLPLLLLLLMEQLHYHEYLGHYNFD